MLAQLRGNQMENFEKFKLALGDSCSAVVHAFLNRRWADLSGVIRSYFTKRIDLTHVTTNSTEEFALKLVHGLAAIECSLSCLRDVETYLANVPEGPGRVRYIYIQVETYLNEMGVLRERVQSYYKCIPKLYRRDPLYPHILSVTSEISVTFEHLIDEILKLEDKHILGVHCRDEHLDVLVALASYAAKLDDEQIGKFEAEIQKVLETWQLSVAGNNRRICEQVDMGFAALAGILINSAGRLVMPRRI